MVRSTPMRLDVFLTGILPLLAVRLGSEGRPVPSDISLDDEARALGRLLDRLRRRGALPARFALQLGSMTDRALPLLQARLVRPDANWDIRKGDVKHGSPGAVLAEQFLLSIKGTELDRVFISRGFRLRATGGTEHIEVGRVPGHGTAILPVYIGLLGLTAVRTGS